MIPPAPAPAPAAAAIVTMKAAVYDTFEGPITVRDVPIPVLSDNDDDNDQTGRGSILLRVHAAGVCRSDWHGWKGHDGDVIAHGLPFIPGHELSGTVVAVGKDVITLVPGDRVAVPFILACGSCRYCNHYQRPTVCTQQEQPGFTRQGGFAEYVVLPRADKNIHKLPAAVSFVQAAALGCRFTTAYRAVWQQGRLAAEDTSSSIAIFGCGGVGLSCVMLAKARKAGQIIAVDVNEAALQKAVVLGATHVVNVTGMDQEEIIRTVKKLTIDGHGADVTVDAAGFASTCENAVHCARPAGRMVQVGLPIGEQQRPQVPMAVVAGKELELVGSHGFAADDLPELLQLVASGVLDPSKLVERQVSLQEGAQAIQDMDHGSPLGITMVTQFRSEKSRL
jgi:alcohol dehydrogenase